MYDRAGNVVGGCRTPNHLTDSGLVSMAKAWGGFFATGVITTPRIIAIGVGTTPPEDTDTQLEAQIYQQFCDNLNPTTGAGVAGIVNVNSVTLQATIDFGQPSQQNPNGVVITEAGLFTQQSPSNILVSRVLLPTPITKTSEIKLLMQFIHTFERKET